MKIAPKKNKKYKPERDEMIETLLGEFLNDHEKSSGRYTSQDICDELRSFIDLEPGEVTSYMISEGYKPAKVEDRIVWLLN